MTLSMLADLPPPVPLFRVPATSVAPPSLTAWLEGVAMVAVATVVVATVVAAMVVTVTVATTVVVRALAALCLEVTSGVAAATAARLAVTAGPKRHSMLGLDGGVLLAAMRVRLMMELQESEVFSVA